MMQIMRLTRMGAIAGLLALTAMLAIPAGAQQQINPTELSVQEDALLEALGRDETVSGRVTIPNEGAADLIKPGGRDWSAFHNSVVSTIVVWAPIVMAVLLALFFLVRGRIRVEHGMSGRRILRFNGIERFAHWLVAVPFILLALTGLNLVVGRYVVLPLVGPDAFGAITQFGKLSHNFLAWPFMLGVVIIFLLWIKDNIPSKLDVNWLKQGGGMLRKGQHPPARRFNAGQKIIFWAVVIGGGILSLTGFYLMFPGQLDAPSTWQFTQVVHGLAAGIMFAVILGHIYIGTLGMEGAFDAMGRGDVDANWAREHHSLWADAKLAKEGARSGSAVKPGNVAPAE